MTVSASGAAMVPQAIASAGRLGPRLLAVLLAAAFLHLNVQVVLWSFLGIEGEVVNLNPVTASWLVVPALLWTWAAVRTAKVVPITVLEGLIACWIALLLVHAGAYYLRHGVMPAAIAFLSWGVWACLLPWGLHHRRLDFGVLFAWLFFLGGLLNAAPALYEVITGGVIFKVATLDAAGVRRVYGISQSPVWLGVQLGVGAVSGLWLIGAASSRVGKLAVVAGTVIQIAALTVAGGRGPLIATGVGILLFGFTVLPHRSWFSTLVVLWAVGGLLPTFLAESGRVARFLGHVVAALSADDPGNAARLRVYASAVDAHLLDSFWLLVYGHGAGQGSTVGRFLGVGELNVESSALKLVYDLGLAGVLLFASIWALVVRQGWQGLKTPDCAFFGVFLAILGILTFEIMIAEPLKGWLMMFYYWATLSAIVQRSRGVES